MIVFVSKVNTMQNNFRKGKGALRTILAIAVFTVFAIAIMNVNKDKLAESPKTSSGNKGDSSSSWHLYKCGRVHDLCYDELRKCIWVLGMKNLYQLDLNKDELSVVVEGLSGHCLALEGDHLWIGGFQTGLWMYDIPSSSTMAYTVENTMQGNTRGLQSNNVWKITVQEEILWLYSSNQVSDWGITRFKYREKTHERRWATWSIRNTGSQSGKEDGLISDTLSAVLPFNTNQLMIVGTRHYGYQIADSNLKKFETKRILPVRNFGIPSESSKVMAKSPRGYEGWICAGQNNVGCSLIAKRGSELWFRVGVQGDARFGNRFGFAAVICCYMDKPEIMIYNQHSTESRPNALDGLSGSINSIACDGEDIWFTCMQLTKSTITRYNRKTYDFTVYNHTATKSLVLDNAVYFASPEGLRRFKKSSKYPTIKKSNIVSTQKPQLVTDKIEVQFDMPLDFRTVDMKSVELWVNGALFSGKVSYDNNNNCIQYTIPNQLPGDMDCELVLKSLIQAENGNPLTTTKIPFRTK